MGAKFAATDGKRLLLGVSAPEKSPKILKKVEPKIRWINMRMNMVTQFWI